MVENGKARIRSGGVVIGENEATGHGGGIALLDKGKLSLTGGVTYNKATGEDSCGGGVYVDTTAKLSFGRQAGSSWYADEERWNAHVEINFNKASGKPSDVHMFTYALAGVDNRIDIDTLDDMSSHDVGLTLDPWPELGEPDAIFTNKLGDKDYSYFKCNNENYGIKTVGSGNDREAAVYPSNIYTVTYKVGSDNYDQTRVIGGNPVEKPDDPEKPGETFLGWFNEEDNKFYDFDTPVTKDITLIGVFNGDHFHDHNYYKPWDKTNELPTEEGFYYLTENVNLPGSWTPVACQHVHICLNGHKITGGGGPIINLRINGESAGNWRDVHIYDCSEGEKGAIEGNSSSESSLILLAGDDTMTLHSGKICNNSSTATNYGGAVSVFNEGTFTMLGGTITGNKAPNGGAVFVYWGTFIMKGGTITDNSAVEGNGGALYINTDSNFEFYGGTIEKNTAAVSGGGVFVKGEDEGIITLDPSGTDMVISDNTANGAVNNVHLNKEDSSNQATIELTGDGKMTESSVIGVTSDEKPGQDEGSMVTLTSGLESRGTINNFRSDEEKYVTEEGNKEAVLKFNPVYKDYTIEYDLAGGSLDEGESNPETVNGLTETFTLKKPKKKGYDFTGWTGTGYEEPAKEVTIEKGSVNENMKFTANWTPTIYNITYDLGGGRLPEGKTNPTEYTIESEKITLINPEKAINDFTGWTGTDLNQETMEVVIEPGSVGDRSYVANFKDKCTDGHKWDEGKVTKAPTINEEGVKTYTCTVCGKTRTESIPKLPPAVNPDQKGSDGTEVGPGASAATAEKAITGMKTDKDPKGAVFARLQFNSPKQTKNSITLKWTKVGQAKTYVIYANKCGKNNKPKKLATLTGSGRTFKKVAGKKLKKGSYYKFIIVALDSNNKVVSTSKLIHVATKGGKAGNHKSVTVKKAVIKKAAKLKKGKSLRLAAKAVLQSRKHKVEKHVAMRYESSNKKIATVSAKGVVKGVKKGKCFVYAYAQDGVFKKIKVVVK